jgi:hypothetical protein
MNAAAAIVDFIFVRGGGFGHVMNYFFFFFKKTGCFAALQRAEQESCPCRTDLFKTRSIFRQHRNKL